MRIDFVANVSHELKTPLTSIKGYTETLKSGALKDPVFGPQFLDRIEENTDRLTAIISDLLLLSHVESFPGDVHWDTFDTDTVGKKLQSTFMPALEKKNQKLILEFSDEKIEGDSKKLEHVFINLIDNAIRYCPPGATIQLRQSKDALHWLVDVTDNGPGIPVEHQNRIFERFYRIDADRSRETGGTGLGLAIVKHIVMLHDGRIELMSEMGKGTTFRIQWPRRQI
jgi:two-component system phosphate regulon sensor histidine kinase PhoR